MRFRLAPRSMTFDDLELLGLCVQILLEFRVISQILGQQRATNEDSDSATVVNH